MFSGGPEFYDDRFAYQARVSRQPRCPWTPLKSWMKFNGRDAVMAIGDDLFILKYR